MTRDSMLLLEKLSCHVGLPRKQGCCGQPAISSSYIKEAIPGMKDLTATLEGNNNPITSPADSYTYVVKSHPTYLTDGPEWASRAEKVAVRMQGLTSFIVSTLGIVDVGASLQERAVYHPSCNLARKLGVKDEPLTLLKNARGLGPLTSTEQNTYCGSGGTFLVKMAEMPGEMVKEKAAHLMEVHLGYSVGTDISCLLNINGRL